MHDAYSENLIICLFILRNEGVDKNIQIIAYFI